jgi:hypothetical protein
MTLPLPSAVVDSLFARMQVRYGADWIRRWEGTDIAAVKAEWAHELGDLPEYALRHGLEYMPIDKPPTVAWFRALCLRAPPPHRPALTEPKPTEEQKVRANAIVQETKRRIFAARSLK